MPPMWPVAHAHGLDEGQNSPGLVATCSEAGFRTNSRPSFPCSAGLHLDALALFHLQRTSRRGARRRFTQSNKLPHELQLAMLVLRINR